MFKASDVKELREKTGAGMLDCKKALEATEGNMEAAVDWLREKGIAKAAKKESRIAAEGLCQIKAEGNVAVMVEVNSETDFVAKNPEFTGFVDYLVDMIINNDVNTIEDVTALEDGGETVGDKLVALTAKIGEKLSFRRFELIEKEDNQAFGAYSHMGGKISALVLLSNASEEVARDVAMHVAASAPQYIDRTEIPAEVLEREKEVLTTQALEENKTAAKPKPENIIIKMVEGRLNKNLSEMCLVDQSFIKDPDQKVGKYIGNGKIEKMVRYLVGEGMEKREENFAEEVAAQMGK